MKINPCPYCGCEDTYIYKHSVGYSVQCPRYYCSRVVVEVFPTERQAVEDWNAKNTTHIVKQ